ncbi:uncharacterized protein LOC121680701 [Alosa sapidissima]|uniref:uncharacterized protein LOC121680701 n=1 Tax=Alosa sapidissima TaxID=34773 RepID=UPI001C098BDD|nr:uncharacterized protein LOC121680701 [Alosa sapidissima]XP_041916167.1 uncharacterized protein LOC121680701 [Alosa sapidissima]XP_041916168.1 uncharacterized protein LOC121680701 [Alosa sapidissima]
MDHQTAFYIENIQHDNIVNRGLTTGIFGDSPVSLKMQVETGQSPVSIHSGFIEISHHAPQTGSEADLVSPHMDEASLQSSGESGTNMPEFIHDQSRRDQFIQGTKSPIQVYSVNPKVNSFPMDSESFAAVQNLANDNFFSSLTGSIKRLAVVQHFFTACQRLRNLRNGCASLRVPITSRQLARAAVSTGIQSCGHIKQTGTSGCADLTTAIDAMETVMERMVLNLDDAATIRVKMEQLLASGALRPLTEMFVNRLRHILSQYDSAESAQKPCTPMLGSTFLQEKYVYAIVERTLKPFLGRLMDGILAQLNEASEEGTPSSTPRSHADLHGGDFSLLTTMMTQEIMNKLSGTICASVENCKATACTEGEDTPTVSAEGTHYHSLVSTVLVQVMRRIEPTSEDFTAFHSDLTERILSGFCSASGLSGYEAYPAVRIQKLCDNVYMELLKNFRTKAMLHGLLVYRQPVLGTVLTKSLVRELLQMSQEEMDIKGPQGSQSFSFLHRLKPSGTLLEAFKSLIIKDARCASKVHPMSSEVTDAVTSCCKNEGQTPEEIPTASSAYAQMFS